MLPVDGSLAFGALMGGTLYRRPRADKHAHGGVEALCTSAHRPARRLLGVRS